MKKILWVFLIIIDILATILIFASPWIDTYKDLINVDMIMFYYHMGVGEGNLSVIYDFIFSVCLPVVFEIVIVSFFS